MQTFNYKYMCILVLTLLLIVTADIAAQDHRVRPAFPIASGEKMLIIPGYVYDSNAVVTSASYLVATNLDTSHYNIPLPVGTTLKRMIVDASDNDGGDLKYMHFRLVRIKNSGAGSVLLREVTTRGYNSDAFAQFVSNPMNHVMLQGWTYYVKVAFSGGPTTSQRIGVIKIIYEP